MTIPYPEPKKTCSKYFLNLEKIISINFEKETQSEYKWYDETTIKSWYGKKTIIPAGWKYRAKGEITTTEKLEKINGIRVDDTKKIAYYKSQIEFIMEDDVKLYEWFDSDDEALKFIDELIQKSGKPYQEFDKK
jgi:hypothetical protein